MDVRFSRRNVTLTDRFQDYVTEKSAKVATLAVKPQVLDIKVSQELGSRGRQTEDRVELTVLGTGPVVRAEASADDKFSAFDLAFARLVQRLRRAKERSLGRRDGKRSRVSLGEAAAAGFSTVDVTPVTAAQVAESARGDEFEAEEEPYSPVVIRRKYFSEGPISLDDALYQMELVGHDFYLFVDSESGLPSVVYRRKGWDYGVISLGDEPEK